MSTIFFWRVAIAALVVIGAGLAAGPLPARADDADAAAQLLSQVQIDPPDAAMQPSSEMICNTESGAVEVHCSQDFSDKARSGKTDTVTIYFMRQPNQLSLPQQPLDAKLRQFGDVMSVDESFSITNKAQNRQVHVPETCEQAAGNGTYSDAFCYAFYGQYLDITSAVAASANAGGIDVNNPVDINRADALVENAVEAVDDLLNPQ